MSMKWIRENYGVPAKRGGRVEFTGGKSGPRLGTITSADGAHLRIRLDGENAALIYHPTWKLTYLSDKVTRKMLPHHARVLSALDGLTAPQGECCVGFKPLMNATGMARQEVRRIVRHLARSGYAQYWRGLCDDMGEFAGAGYCITEDGRRILGAQL